MLVLILWFFSSTYSRWTPDRRMVGGHWVSEYAIVSRGGFRNVCVRSPANVYEIPRPTIGDTLPCVNRSIFRYFTSLHCFDSRACICLTRMSLYRHMNKANTKRWQRLIAVEKGTCRHKSGFKSVQGRCPQPFAASGAFPMQSLLSFDLLPTSGIKIFG